VDKELRILLLEDVRTDAELMERELRKAELPFSLHRVETKEAFVRGLEKFRPHLILADYKLPSFDGLSALAIAQKKCPQVPFIFVSGVLGEGMAIETLKKGAIDYVLKSHLSRLVPAIRRALDEVEERIKRKQAEEEIKKLAKFPSEDPNPVLRVAKDGTLLYANKASLTLLNVWGCRIGQLLPGYWRNFALDALNSGLRRNTEVECKDRGGVHFLTFAPVMAQGYVNVYGIDITELKRVEKKLERSLKKLRRALKATIQAMALTVETRDAYTAGHQQRVTDLARAIATEMKLSKDQIDGIRMAGTIHDIGKIGVPAEILNKPTRLADIEFNLIKIHPLVGYNILKQIEFLWPVAKIVLQHHERMNGSGYPHGLSGEDILLEARILGVADVVEAMASHRPALGIDKALEEVSKNKGVFYDPQVVDACLKLFREKGFKFKTK